MAYTQVNTGVYFVHPSKNDVASTAGLGRTVSEDSITDILDAVVRSHAWVTSGFDLNTTSGLTVTLNGGKAIMEGYLVSRTGTVDVLMTASVTNHVFLTFEKDGSDNVTSWGFEVNSTDTAPTTPYIKIIEVVCDGSSVTGTTDKRELRDPYGMRPHVKLVAPTATDDYANGYKIGDTWIDSVLNIAYTCVDQTTGAAIWLTAAGSGADHTHTTASITDWASTFDARITSTWRGQALGVASLDGSSKILLSELSGISPTFTTLNATTGVFSGAVSVGAALTGPTPFSIYAVDNGAFVTLQQNTKVSMGVGGSSVIEAFASFINLNQSTTVTGTLKVGDGASGATADTDYNDIVVDSAGKAGISILPGEGFAGRIVFGEGIDNTAAAVMSFGDNLYLDTQNAGGNIYLRSGAGVTALSVLAGGDAALVGSLTVGGAAAVQDWIGGDTYAQFAHANSAGSSDNPGFVHSSVGIAYVRGQAIYFGTRTTNKWLLAENGAISALAAYSFTTTGAVSTGALDSTTGTFTGTVTAPLVELNTPADYSAVTGISLAAEGRIALRSDGTLSSGIWYGQNTATPISFIGALNATTDDLGVWTASGWQLKAPSATAKIIIVNALELGEGTQASTGSFKINGGNDWIGLKTRTDAYTWAVGDNASEHFTISSHDGATWIRDIFEIENDAEAGSLVVSQGVTTVGQNLAVTGNLDLGNTSEIQWDGHIAGMRVASGALTLKNNGIDAVDFSTNGTARFKRGILTTTNYGISGSGSASNYGGILFGSISGTYATIKVVGMNSSGTPDANPAHFWVTGDTTLDGAVSTGALTSTTGTFTDEVTITGTATRAFYATRSNAGPVAEFNNIGYNSLLTIEGNATVGSNHILVKSGSGDQLSLSANGSSTPHYTLSTGGNHDFKSGTATFGGAVTMTNNLSAANITATSGNVYVNSTTDAYIYITSETDFSTYGISELKLSHGASGGTDGTWGLRKKASKDFAIYNYAQSEEALLIDDVTSNATFAGAVYTGALTVTGTITATTDGTFPGTVTVGTASASDAALAVHSTDTWAGIQFTDPNATSYLFYNGGSNTFDMNNSGLSIGTGSLTAGRGNFSTGVAITSANSRITFAGYRAVEGDITGTNLILGESYAWTRIYSASGLHVNANATVAGTLTTGALTGTTSYATTTGTNKPVQFTTSQSAATTGYLYGLTSNVSSIHATGTVAGLYAINGVTDLYTSGGTTTAAVGLRAEVLVRTGTTATTAYSVFIAEKTRTGSIGTGYALYSGDTDQSYLAGPLTINANNLTLSSNYNIEWGGSSTVIYGHNTNGLNFLTQGATRLKIEDGGASDFQGNAVSTGTLTTTGTIGVTDTDTTRTAQISTSDLSGVTKSYFGQFSNTTYISNNTTYVSGWAYDDVAVANSAISMGNVGIAFATAPAGTAAPVGRWTISPTGSLVATGAMYLTTTGPVSTGALTVNAGTGNEVATFTSTDTTSYIRLTDSSDTLYVTSSSGVGYIGGNATSGGVSMEINLSSGAAYFRGTGTALTVSTTESWAHIGNAKVGSWEGATGYAFFGHKTLDHSVTTNYALIQDAQGSTFLNAASTKAIYFRIANAQAGIWSASSLDVTGGFSTTGAATINGTFTASSTAYLNASVYASSVIYNTRTAATSTAYQNTVTGDAVGRWIVQSDGKMSWGDGTNAVDTNLYRDSANTLKTDDALIVGGQFDALGIMVVTGNASLNGATTTIGGAATVGSTLTVTGATTASDFILSGNTGLRRNTSDAADTGYVYVTGGGAESDGRGAIIRLYGNEHATLGGDLSISGGNVAGAEMTFRTAGVNVGTWTSTALTVNQALAVTGASTLTGTTTLGSSAHLWLTTNGTAIRYVGLTGGAANTGVLALQAGPGSAGFGGGLQMYGHTHATRPGWVVAGVSASSGGSFAVQNWGVGDTTPTFTVLASNGNTAVSGTLTVTGATTFNAIPTVTLSSAQVIVNNTLATGGGSFMLQSSGTNHAALVAYGTTHATVPDQVWLKNYTAGASIYIAPNGGSASILTVAPTGVTATGTLTVTGITDAARFQVSGTSQYGADFSTRGAVNSYEWGHANTAGYGNTLGYDSSAGWGWIGFGVSAGTTVNTYKTWGQIGALIKNISGNLYFGRVPLSGTDNQSQTIDFSLVGGNATFANALTVTGATTLTTAVVSGASNHTLNFSGTSAVDGRGISFNNRTALTADDTDGWLRLNDGSGFTSGVYTPGTFRSDGSIGIGLSPTKKLHVKGSTYGDAILRLDNGSHTWDLEAGQTSYSSQALSWYYDGVQKLRLMPTELIPIDTLDLGYSGYRWNKVWGYQGDFSGAVTLGSSLTLTDGDIDMSSETTGVDVHINLWDFSNNWMSIGINDSPATSGITSTRALNFKHNTGGGIHIDTSGNVGINDDTPGYKLDVNGTLRVVGALTATNFISTYEAATHTTPSQAPNNFYFGWASNDGTNYPTGYGTMLGHTVSSNGYGYGWQLYKGSGGTGYGGNTTDLHYRGATTGNTWNEWRRLLHVNTSGSINATALTVPGSLNVTGTATFSAIAHFSNAAGYASFYSSPTEHHSIVGKDETGTANDDIRINTYGALYINLDSNANNSSTADFKIGRHGNLATISDWLFTVDGEGGGVTIEKGTTTLKGSGDGWLAMNVHNTSGSAFDTEIHFTHGTSDLASKIISHYVAGGYGELGFYTNAGATLGLYQDQAGYVGVATASPDVPLTVARSTTGTVARFYHDSVGTQRGGGFASDESSGGRAMMFLDVNGANFSGGDYFYITQAVSAGGVTFMAQESAPLIWGIAGNQVATMTTGQAFVMASTSDNNATIRAQRTIALSGDYAELATSGGTGVLRSGNELVFQTNDTTEVGRVDTSGRWMFGTTSTYSGDVVNIDGRLNTTRDMVSNTAYDLWSLRSDRTINDYGAIGKQYMKWYFATPGATTTGESAAHAYGDLRLAFTDAADTTLDDRFVFRYNGHMGIGTMVPQVDLHVEFTDATAYAASTAMVSAREGIQIENTSTTAGAYSAINLRAGTADCGIATVYESANTGRMEFIVDNGGSPISAMTIDSAGKVGIGTATPAHMVHVENTVSAGSVDLVVKNLGNTTDTVPTAGIWLPPSMASSNTSGPGIQGYKTGTYATTPERDAGLKFWVLDGNVGVTALSIDNGSDAILTGKMTVNGGFLHVDNDSTNEIRLAGGATSSPFYSFYQNTTRRSYVQHLDTNDTLLLDSEYGKFQVNVGNLHGALAVDVDGLVTIPGDTALASYFKVGDIVWNNATGGGVVIQYRGSDDYGEIGINNMAAAGSAMLVARNGSGVVFSVQNDGNVRLGSSSAPASATNTLTITNGTAPTGNVTNGVALYSEDVSASAELKVRDEAGNITTLSPHNFSLIPDGPSEEMAWAYYSEKDGTAVNVDMLKLARLVEELTGEQLVYIQEQMAQ